MHAWMIKTIAGSLGALGFAVLAGCSSGRHSATGPSIAPTTANAPRPAAATTPTTARAPAVNPNAPEVNPAGDIPDNQVFVTYAPPAARYTIRVPEGWARTETGGVITFTDNFNAIDLQQRPTPAPPTVASVTAVDVAAIANEAADYRAGKVTAVTRKAGRAVLATYRADSPPNPVTSKTIHRDVERYAFWHNRTEVIVTLSGPVGADNVDPWRIVTDSLRWR